MYRRLPDVSPGAFREFEQTRLVFLCWRLDLTGRCPWGDRRRRGCRNELPTCPRRRLQLSTAGLSGRAPRAGDEVRFHVRDATAAKNDLDLQLRRYALERAYSSAASSIEACLVIPCVGRGRLLFGESGGDSRTIGAALGGQAAVGGFFANGELGPVGAVVGSASAPVYRRRTHQHDYAVVAMVFGEADAEEE